MSDRHLFFCLLWLAGPSRARFLNIEDFGAVATGAVANASAVRNRDALAAALAAAAEGDVVVVPRHKSYVMLGGVRCSNKTGVSLSIEGTLLAEPDRRVWPLDGQGNALHFITVVGARNFTVTGGGQVDGNGMGWWDGFILGELPGDRPRLFVFDVCADLLFERLTLRNSPDQNVNFNRCARVEARFVDIVTERFKQRELKTRRVFSRARESGFAWVLGNPHLREFIQDIQHRGEYPGRTWKDWLLDDVVKLLPPFLLEPEDLNTDGFDPSGTDIYIHDCNILNDDDSIAVKPTSIADEHPGGPTECTQNILVENMVMTGFGASIGSVGPHADVNCVRNVTFRNISMPKPGKGIYIKSNPGCGTGVDRNGRLVETTAVIDQITYENVTVVEPFWWAIWIGPQQQHEPGSKLGDKCALTYPFGHSSCPTQGCVTFSNIALRDVRIERPVLSPGVVLGNGTNPMLNITFDRVNTVFDTFRGRIPFGRGYLCHGAHVTSLGSNPEACGAVEVEVQI